MFRPWTTLAKVGLVVVAPFIILTFYHQPSLPITSCHLEPHYLSGFSIPRIHRTENTLTNFRNNSRISLQCTMLPLLTKSCLKSNKLRPILIEVAEVAVAPSLLLLDLSANLPEDTSLRRILWNRGWLLQDSRMGSRCVWDWNVRRVLPRCPSGLLRGKGGRWGWWARCWEGGISSNSK